MSAVTGADVSGVDTVRQLAVDVDQVREEIAATERAAARQDRLIWLILLGAMAFAAVGVAVFAVKHGVPKQVAWGLDPLVACALVIVIQGDAVLGRHVKDSPGWGKALRIFAGLATLAANTWSWWAAADWAGVFLHAIAPCVLIGAAEASVAYRKKYAELVAELRGKLAGVDEAARTERDRAAERAAAEARDRRAEQAAREQAEAERDAEERRDQLAAERDRLAAAERQEAARLALEERRLEIAAEADRARLRTAEEARRAAEAEAEAARVRAAADTERTRADTARAEAEAETARIAAAEQRRRDQAADRERRRQDRTTDAVGTTPGTTPGTTVRTTGRTTAGTTLGTAGRTTSGTGTTAGRGTGLSTEQLLARARELDVQARTGAGAPITRRRLQAALGIGSDRAQALLVQLADGPDAGPDSGAPAGPDGVAGGLADRSSTGPGTPSSVSAPALAAAPAAGA